ncbi:hypothetical protein Ade02nite_20830 [Paractinoplanes deccanensis]|uniref:Uncharacterized protein n=1 Tax=Paractinoplanes deccanensis TaxID=113561 RepID=A0ABQ3Y0B3_9ACTN|nr:hypothetical protein [Actinoplanes deccanensis]GID73442.1 hypothetical protein Ade02nite_20830 [Actinoplanes deccanensis]
MLEATPERVAYARRAQDRQWTFGPENAGEIMTDDVLGEMVVEGLIAPHFVTPTQQINGQDDYYRLTEAGERWLAAADAAYREKFDDTEGI